MQSVLDATEIVLKYRLDLRTIDKREKVWGLVKLTIPHAKFSTVERMCRKIQNTDKLYLPQVEDNRYKYSNEYRTFFSDGKENTKNDVYNNSMYI